MSSKRSSPSDPLRPPAPGPQPACPGRGTYRLFRALIQLPLERLLGELRRQRPEDTPVGKDRRPQLSVTLADREQLEALAELLGAPLSVTVNLALAGLARHYELQEEAAAELGASALQQIAEHFFFERGLSFEEAVGLAAQVHPSFSWWYYEEMRDRRELKPDQMWVRYQRLVRARSAEQWRAYERGDRPPALEEMMPEGFRWRPEEQADFQAGEGKEATRASGGRRRRRRVKVTPESEALLEAVAERLGSSRAGAYEVALRHLAYELGLLEGRR